MNRRRSYTFQVPSTLPAERQPFPSREILVEKGVSEIKKRRIVRIQRIKLIDEGRNIQVTLQNRSGKVLERVQIRITLLAGELFESHNWETTIREWFPAEALDFEFPRFDDNSEYIVSLTDADGKLLTKKVAVAELLEK